jgi:cytochrome c-type biogenesis protein CcmH/NrfG
MANAEDVRSGYVKKETMITVAFITLVVGFIGGVVYSSFKFASDPSGSGSFPSQQVSEGQEIPSEPGVMIQELETETLKTPDSAAAWSRLGNAYFDSDNFEKAIAAYKKSLALDNTNANVWTDMGVMYRRNGQPDEAVRAFDEAIKADPLHETSRMNKGIVLMHDLGDLEGAADAWEGLLKINPLAQTPNGQPVIELFEKLKSSMN